MAAGIDISTMNKVAWNLYDKGGWLRAFQNGIESSKEFAPDYVAEIFEENILYFSKIKALCEQNGIELKLVKIPSIYIPRWPVYQTSAWTEIKSNLVTRFSIENQIDL